LKNEPLTQRTRFSIDPLVAAPGPAQLDGHAELEHDLREGRVPLQHLAVRPPGQRDRRRPIEHRRQRHPTHCREMPHERPRQRLDPLVRYQRDLRPARVLQARREEAHQLHAATEEADLHLPEVVLRELARDPLEAHERLHRARPSGGDQVVQSALAAAVPFQARATQNLE
jgi:hypothetical protein